MLFTKVFPILSLPEFIQRVSAIHDFGTSTRTSYHVVRMTDKSLFIRRLGARDKERLQRLDLRRLYKALTQLETFGIENFRDFIPRMHSPGRALLLHLGLIVQNQPQKIIFFNTGWMTAYRGLKGDKLQGGGKHVVTHGWGSEMFNFLPFRKKLYGYVQPKIDRKYNNESTIKIEKLGALPEDEYIDGITVVWTASDPVNGDTRIIGWYKNARIYRYHHLPSALSDRRYKEELQGYYAVAKVQDCTLLSIDARKVKVFRQRKSWMGQSNVWFAEQNPTFVQQVSEYILHGRRPDVLLPGRKRKAKGIPRQPDFLKRLKVEQAAITCVSHYYKKEGYFVQSVERDNVGWDLTATDDENSLKLEVKGLSGTSIMTELTPNEYDQMGQHKTNYRICVVTDALREPQLHIFHIRLRGMLGPILVVLSYNLRKGKVPKYSVCERMKT